MQNLLIIENELVYSHFLANSICKEFDNIRLYNIVDTGQKALEIIDEQIADIIILDLRLPDISGIEILDYIRNSKIQKYLSSIIAITSDTELLNKVLGNEYIYSYYSKIDTINSIINILYQKTCTSIKTSIFQSISIMYYEIEEDKLFSYLGYYSNKKPKAKDIIYTILQKL